MSLILFLIDWDIGGSLDSSSSSESLSTRNASSRVTTWSSEASEYDNFSNIVWISHRLSAGMSKVVVIENRMALDSVQYINYFKIVLTQNDSRRRLRSIDNDIHVTVVIRGVGWDERRDRGRRSDCSGSGWLCRAAACARVCSCICFLIRIRCSNSAFAHRAHFSVLRQPWIDTAAVIC